MDAKTRERLELAVSRIAAEIAVVQLQDALLRPLRVVSAERASDHADAGDGGPLGCLYELAESLGLVVADAVALPAWATDVEAARLIREWDPRAENMCGAHGVATYRIA